MINNFTPKEGRLLISEFNNSSYLRIPVETHFVEIGEKLEPLLDKYVRPILLENDIVCIATKILSITKGLVVHKDTVTISPLAKLITRFVKKWPNDIGYSNPRKMQVAINRVGYPRTIFAIIGGLFMKLFGKPGYFYKIAGNRINAIDGFTIGFTTKQIFEDYAFLPPTEKEGNTWADELESYIGSPVVFLDGNNIDNNVMGMSKGVKQRYTEEEFMQIVHGNPQGQEGDGANTPILIVRETK